MQFRDGVFIIVEEDRCPLYNVYEELKIRDGMLSLPPGKSACLSLAKRLSELVIVDDDPAKNSRTGSDNVKLECGGCTGIIRFEHKEDKDFSTPQMRMLAAAMKGQKRQNKKSQFIRLLGAVIFFRPSPMPS